MLFAVRRFDRRNWGKGALKGAEFGSRSSSGSIQLRGASVNGRVLLGGLGVR